MSHDRGCLCGREKYEYEDCAEKGCWNKPQAANDNAPVEPRCPDCGQVATYPHVCGPTVYFDMDGVLADFDSGAERILGTNNIYKYEFVYGQDAFWEGLNSNPAFFRDLDVLPGAQRMVRAVRHHPRGIITALPKTNGDRVREQKTAWIRANISGKIPVIACMTHEKPNYCKPGDVLIDDRAVNKAKWEAKGGRFIVHTDVGSTMAQLDSMGLLKQ